jgi:hypothetical protein
VRDIARLDGTFDRFPRLLQRRAGVLEDLLDRPGRQLGAEHVGEHERGRAAAHQHRGEHHDRRAQPGPERAALNSSRQFGAGVRPAHATRDLQQLVLRRHDRRCGQIDHLVACSATHDPVLRAEFMPALAPLLGTNSDRLVGIVDELARRALMPRLGALLAL